MALSVLIAGLIVVGTGVSAYLIDDRTRADSTEQLRRMAFHDPLTGLANRRALHQRLATLLAGRERFTLLLLDLDHFKAINDTFGHAIGDRLLVESARRIGALAGDDSFAARIGGDELAVLLPGDDDRTRLIADNLVHALGQPFVLQDQTIGASCSIGICASSFATDGDDLLQKADVALYEAKRGGRGRAFIYRAGMAEAAADRRQLERDMRQGLAARQFSLVYQPIVGLSETATIGFEALIRWQHPSRGTIGPADFIPLAEANGFIIELGEWVLREACRTAAAWTDGSFVAVNVSAVQLSSPRLLAHVSEALAESGLPAGRLEIELTETAIVANGTHVAHALADLRALGVRIAMDDFGTGYSSLAHLVTLPLDRIKIDRRFVATAASDRNAMAVLNAITQLGRDIGIDTLGEGVETGEQLELLRALGCSAAQGYLLGRPGAVGDTAGAATDRNAA
jgi:diguanylate cyclase (GGDEF)-like protein